MYVVTSNLPRWVLRSVMGLALLGLLHYTATSAELSDAEKKQIADLEKQIEDAKKKLAELKSSSKKPLSYSDVALWRNISVRDLSRNGDWFAYRVGPADGDSEVIIRQTKGDKEHKFPVGSGFGSVEFSNDSKWVTFTVNPPKQPNLATALTGSSRPPEAAIALINLTNGEKKTFDGIRRASFNGDKVSHLALLRTPPPPPATTTPDAASRIPRGLLPNLPTTPNTPTGADLILYDLAKAEELVLGNVSDFGFDEKGNLLTLLIDAKDQIGNGIQIRNMTTGVIQPLETGKATYSRLTWAEKDKGFTVLKSVEDKTYEGKLTSIVAYTNLEKTPEKIVYEPSKDTNFPKEMTISTSRPASFTEDMSSLVFNIQELKKREAPANPFAKSSTPPTDPAKKEAKGPPSTTPRPSSPEAKDKPDLVIWHWQDESLQSQQEKRAPIEKTTNYLSSYRIKDKKFVRLADEKIKQVSVGFKHRYGVGIDNKEYARMSSLDGKQFQDVYVVDLATGTKKLALKKARWYFGMSPDETHLLYYQDGHFFSYEIASEKSYNLTEKVPTSFIDLEDDHPVEKPPTRPMGWTSEGQFVLLADDWDIWKIPVHGGTVGENITVDGKKEGIRYRARLRTDPDEKGIDLTKPQYFSLVSEWSKKAGFARLDPGKAGLTKLLFEDAEFGGFTKARNADTFVYTRETVKDYPDFYSVDASFKNPKRLTNANPQQEKYLWCSGAKLIEYSNDRGQRLQGTLFLPADYQSGKKYPTIVYIYEKLSNNTHRYSAPTFSGSGFNLALYTSNGYAVLMPDITYQINDPGKSSVGCVVPALNAAIATGIVEKDKVGLQGHSWGGYQTAFMVTQTNAFKAAVAGAPLTNLVSMYSSIYWNVGIANQPIFESSQGRFTGGYWDEWDAYIRNSPIYFAKNVNTPLMMLHNDKDGAVDFNQGIEYFNTLRRLNKPVIMLQYKGENHGLAKLANRKDYTIRMREFFDHYLQGKPAPKWMKEGIPHLKMDDHLKEHGKD